MTRAPRRQNRGVWWLALIVVCAAVATITLPAQTARTQERDLFVSVLDAAGNPVTNLAPADVLVREDRLAREVLRARRATDPIDLAILVDNSQASTNDIHDLRRALEVFVKKMADAGPVSLTTVADRPTLVQDYTRDADALQIAVGRLFPVAGSGATVLEAISEVLKGLKTRQPERAADERQPRHVAEHQAQDARRGGADRHAQADLARPLGDGEGEQAIQAERGEQRRGEGEADR